MSGTSAAERAPSILQQLLRQAVLIAVSIVTIYPVLWVFKTALTPGAALSGGAAASAGRPSS